MITPTATVEAPPVTEGQAGQVSQAEAAIQRAVPAQAAITIPTTAIRITTAEATSAAVIITTAAITITTTETMAAITITTTETMAAAAVTSTGEPEVTAA